MSCSESNTGGEQGEIEESIIRNSVEVDPKSFTQNGSIVAPQLTIDENLLVDPKLIFIGSKVGEGAHGKVYEGRYGDQIVAIKVLHRGSTSEERAALEGRFAREVNMMSRVKHENLVKWAYDISCLCSLLELVRIFNGDSYRAITSFALDIARAMECLHANGIIHRDLKPDNLLLTANQKSVKLADFGLAREESVTEMMTAETGTYRWMAPEVCFL
ncbi:Serine/threonine-protein kinase STY46 [Vitis vinifera]|uniref:Serine/threonine-protein kinase STY46 n=1 Tax=Vitis vinifera TaxID=29760 RepID=A0A438DZG7_VITVI|nr:Serine/threonine-protein kinase STY46 [Vitis vinifera]